MIKTDSFFKLARCWVCALMAASGLARADYLRYVDYYDICWSSDSRRIVYTYALDLFEETYFPHEAIAFVAADDTSPTPVVLTPPLDRVFPFDGRQLAVWSEHDGWFVLDLDDPRVARSIGVSCPELDYVPRTVGQFEGSPNGSVVAVICYDVASDYQVLLAWRLGSQEATLVTENVGGFRWSNDSTVVCSLALDNGVEYASVNVLNGARHSASRQEYADAAKARVQAEVPVRPGPAVDGDRDPVPAVSESVLVVTRPGAGPKRIRLPVAGLPVNPVISPDGSRIALDIRHGKEVWVALLALDGSGFRVVDSGWSPQWLGNDSLLYHNNLGFGIAATDGDGHRQVLYPRTAHHPRWLSDSVIEFRVGRGGDKPEPFHIAPSAYRYFGDYDEAYYLARDSHVYRHDELWQVNVHTGRFARLEGLRPEPVVRVKSQRWGRTVPSPDGQRIAVMDERGDVEVRDRDGREGRTLLLRRW